MPKNPNRYQRPNQYSALASLIGAALSSVLVLGGCATAETPQPGVTTVTLGPPAPTEAAPTSNATPLTLEQTTSAPAGSKQTYSEIADRRPVLQLWNNNTGSEMTGGSLPLGTVVQVECLAPNDTGMLSADPGFYRFQYDGRTVFAISNEFANGDPVGVNGYNTVVDPKVPAC